MKKSDRMSVAEYRARGGTTIPTEEQECTWLFEWARMTRRSGMLIADILIHVPNGAYLGADKVTRGITMGKLKAMGLQPGCFDYIIPVQRGRYPGLWLEMKRTKGGVVSSEQVDFALRMANLGWRTEICKGWKEASKVIEAYLAAVQL